MLFEVNARHNKRKPTWRLGVVASQFSNSISDIVGIEGASIVGKHAARRRDSDAYAMMRTMDIDKVEKGGEPCGYSLL